MSLQWTCQHCKKVINVPATLLGKSAPCPNPKCGQMIDFPLNIDAGDQRNAWTPQRIGDLVLAGAIALVFHVAFLILAQYIISESKAGDGAEFDVAIAELPKGEELTKGEEGGLDTTAETVTRSSTSDALDTLEITAPSGAKNSGETSIDIGEITIAPGGGGGGDVDFAGGLAGGAGGGGGGFGGKARFMGAEASGRRFLIIADNSSSMVGPPLDFVKKEIGRTLNDMPPGTEFYIIFFNSFAVPMPGNKWHKARGDVSKAMTWVQGIESMGGTEPGSAFQAAFQMKPLPDAIWFMTDGQFDPYVAQTIAQLNKPRSDKRVIIHTISFLDNSAANLMQNIAKQSGGTYRHVRGF